MITEIYIVTKGSYSDYSICGIFTDKALAEEYAQQITDHWGEARVETKTIMTSTDLPAPPGFRGYDIEMDIDGNCDIFKSETYDVETKNDGYAETEYKINDDKKLDEYYTGRYNFYVLTDKGSEGAIKIANERRIRMIAENKWPVNGSLCTGQV